MLASNLNRVFDFAILLESGKRVNVIERLHSSLIGFVKFHAPFFKNLLKIWSTHAAFVTSIFFNNLNKASLDVGTNLEFLESASFL